MKSKIPLHHFAAAQEAVTTSWCFHIIAATNRIIVASFIHVVMFDADDGCNVRTVFARSSLSEQTTPMSLPIVDSVASVTCHEFVRFKVTSGELTRTSKLKIC